MGLHARLWLLVLVEEDESEFYTPKLQLNNPRVGNPVVRPYQAVSVGEELWSQ